MLIRLTNARRLQASFKAFVFILAAILYITFLCRQTLNAFEKKKNHHVVATVPAANAFRQTNFHSKFIIKNALKNGKFEQEQDVEKLNQDDNAVATTATSSTLNPVYEYSEEIHCAIEKDLQKRNQHLQAVCKKYQLSAIYPPNPREFFISYGHNLIWCNVFKAASTTWMYYFNILGGYDIKYLQRTQKQPLELARKRFPRPELYKLLESLHSSLVFLFVRDPFERIVSAYRNKLEGGKYKYYRTLVTGIIKRFRKLPCRKGKNKCGLTFNEFIQYLIEQHQLKKTFDEHWAPIYSFCTPCSVQFNIIGKVETFARDTEFIIRQAGLEPLLLGKLPKTLLSKIGNLAKGLKTDSLVARYFANITRNELDQLLNIYRLDFELFDYDYSKYFEYVRNDQMNETIPTYKNPTLKQLGNLTTIFNAGMNQ